MIGTIAPADDRSGLDSNVGERPSNPTALRVSLAVIAVYWLYELSSRSNPTLPGTFQELVLTVVRNKLTVFVAIVVVLRMQRERFAAIGFSSRNWSTHLSVGLVTGVVMFVGLNVVLTSVLNSLIPHPAPSASSVLSFFSAPRNLLVWLPSGIFGGGLVEEMERIFVITRFEKWLGRPGLALGVGLSSAMFGFGHLYQGLAAALSTGCSGLVFALVFLRRRSAIEPVVAHAFSDVLAMIAATLLAQP